MPNYTQITAKLLEVYNTAGGSDSQKRTAVQDFIENNASAYLDANQQVILGTDSSGNSRKQQLKDLFSIAAYGFADASSNVAAAATGCRPTYTSSLFVISPGTSPMPSDRVAALVYGFDRLTAAEKSAFRNALEAFKNAIPTTQNAQIDLKEHLTYALAYLS